MRFLAIGDFHGKCSFSIKKIVKENNIDFILCTGDLCNADRQRTLIFRHWQMMRLGFELGEIVGRKYYNRLTRSAVKSQDKILKKLAESDVPVFLIYGNNDYPEKAAKQEKIKLQSLEKKIKKHKNLRLLKKAMIKFKGYCIIGISGYEPKLAKKKTGFNAKNIKTKLKGIKREKTILLTHEPPFGYLDKVKWKKSPMYGKHIGNYAALRLIKQIKPAFHICGHMHENQGRKNLGRTAVVNHGPAYDKHYAIVCLNTKKVKFF